MGIAIGLIIGLIVAAGIAWYLTSKPGPFKTTAQAPLVPPAAPEVVPEAPAPGAPKPAAPVPRPPQTDTAPPTPAVPALPPPKADVPAPAKAAPAKPAPPAKSDFTFFDILPGEQGGKASGQKLVREVWWLQVAALREAKDADRLKARLALLGLPVQTQQVTSGEATLHRVRVGPFKTEDEALGALDTLSENDFEPRLLKERLNPP
jgi:cell division protein FtsN